MQVTENDTAILYYSQLRGDWPDAAAALFQRALAYAKRLATDAQEIEGRRTLAGVSLARRALSAWLGRDVAAREFVFPEGGKPHVPGAPDFSIAHSGTWVGCAVVPNGRIGFDVEVERPGIEQTIRLLVPVEEAEHLTPQTALARWVATEAALKAHGASVREAKQVEFRGNQVFFRGEPLCRMDVDVFEGAAACIMTSQPVHRVETQQVPLSDLF
jgi:4'-phosphopantetheinyl transferase